MGCVMALRSLGPYPADVLDGAESALFLFGAAFGGTNDVAWAERSGIKDVTVVDNDEARLADMRGSYPEDWRFVAADAFAFAEDELASGRRYDVVSLDPYTGDMTARCRANLPVFLRLVRSALVLGIEPGIVVKAPSGWRATRHSRSLRAEWLVLEWA